MAPSLGRVLGSSIVWLVQVFFLRVEEMQAMPTRPTGKYGYEYFMQSPRKECAHRMTDYKYCDDARKAFKMPCCNRPEIIHEYDSPKGCLIRYFPHASNAAFRYRWYFNEHKTGCTLKDKYCASHDTTVQEVCLSASERLCEAFNCHRRPLWQCKLNGCKGQKMDLRFKQLTGTLPAKIDEFLHDMKDSLTEMLFGNNQLTGVIPTPLQEFKQINYLELSRNSLHGRLPSFLGNFNHLTSLCVLARTKCPYNKVELGTTEQLVVRSLSHEQFVTPIN